MWSLSSLIIHLAGRGESCHRIPTTHISDAHQQPEGEVHVNVPISVLPTQFFHGSHFLPYFFTLTSRAPKKYLSKETVRILTLREQNVPIKDIFASVGRSQATIFCLLAAAHSLLPDITPAHKLIPGRPWKTSQHTDVILKRERMKEPSISSTQIKQRHPKLLKDISIRTVHHSLQKDLNMLSRRAAQKPLLTAKMHSK